MVPSTQPKRFAKSRLGPWHLLLAALLSVGLCLPVSGQDIDMFEPPLIDQTPADLIILKAEAGSEPERVKVLPIPFPNRELPSNPRDSDKIEVVLEDYPDRQYEIAWRAIEKIELYEQRIYDEALAKMREKDFIAAFQNLSFLMKNYPGMRRLEGLRQEFLLKSAADRYAAGEFPQTLSALEELRDTAPGYQSATVERVLSEVAGSLIDSYQQAGDLGSAKALLNRLRSKYGPTLPVVQTWQRKLQDLAQAKRAQAVTLIEAKRFREAREAVMEMLSILPDLEEGKRLIREINSQHPMIRVGVMQRSGELNPSSLINWPARRAGSLVYQSVFQFLETGAEGGRYGFALGPPARQSDDRQQLILSLDPNVSSSLDAFGLAQLVLQRADPQHPDYDPSWAAIFKSVSAKSAKQLVVQLKRPNVLPQALLQWTLPDEPARASPLPGKYERTMSDEFESSFTLRPGNERQGQPVEIVEIFYEDPKDAVNDLLRGEIDILDQLYPADAKRLAASTRLRIGSYALPTTHMLIPVSDDPYLAKDKFRRALLYATNRQAMLTGELLNSENLDDGRLVSGPFPIGGGESDPLAYAYNADITPTEYSPHLARLLIVMAEQELQESAKKTKQPLPERKKLTVGCPDFEFARVAVQGMIQQWMSVGIEAEMVILPPGETSHPSVECDLLYLTTTMWEPATDIERLLGGNGIATTDNPFIVLALEKLRAARNWREVRLAMQDLHQLVDYHLPVLPLWQVTDRFAVSRYVEGLEEDPVSLYQDVASWRVNLDLLKTAQR